MLQIIPNRNIFISLSVILVFLSYAALARWGVRLGIDYTGGSLSEVRFAGADAPLPADIQKKLTAEGFDVSSVQRSAENSFLVRMKTLDAQEHRRYLQSLASSFARSDSPETPVRDASPPTTDDSLDAPVAVDTPAEPVITSSWEEKRFESVGPTIGEELRKKSIWAVIAAIIAIVLYITYSFRKVSKPVASWKYGICAFVALAHDVSIPIGFMAFMGRYHGWEIDLLFVTALLTILGFSIHDTIVVYDRIRENLMRSKGKTFDDVANASVNQTLARSINTSLTTIIVLTALTFFGGDTTQRFTLVLIIGIFFGTYSSIFVASPLLVSWHRFASRPR